MAVRVFISYSHDSSEHMNHVLALSNRLRADGVDCIVDRYQQAPEEGWPRWTLRQIEKADFILVVCSETYTRRMLGEEPEGTGRGAKWEGAIITQELYDAESTSKRFVPILPAGGDASHVPVLLRGQQNYPPFAADGSLDAKGYEELYRLLTDQPAVFKPGIGRVKPMPALASVADFGTSAPTKNGSPPPNKPAGGDEPTPDADATAPGRPENEDGRPVEPVPIQPLVSDVGPQAPPVWRKWLLLGLLSIASAMALVFLMDRLRATPDYREPLSYDYRYFEVMPFALFHSIPANKEELYWLKLTVRNGSTRNISVRVTCEAYPDETGRVWALCFGQNERKAGKVADYTVDAKATKVRVLNPRLRLLIGDNFLREKPLTIEWSVSPSRGQDSETGIHEGGPREPQSSWTQPVDIQVAPKNRYYFRLADNTEREVDQNLMLASLAAWTKIDTRSEPAKTIADNAESLDGFVRNVYEKLLQDRDGLHVTGAVPPFPPDPYEEIRPASTLWEKTPRNANPLETALMIGALAHKRKPLFGDRLVLVWPGSGSGAEDSLFLAWQSDGGWNGIDLAKVESPFEENFESARIRVSALLDQTAAEELSTKGVHLKSNFSLAAIDFVQAAKFFNIEGLP